MIFGGPGSCIIKGVFILMMFSRILLVSFVAVGLWMPLAYQSSAQAASVPAGYPQFSWKRVPVWADFCAPQGFNAGEEKFIATHFSGIDIEGTQGLNGKPPSYNVESNDMATAAAIKKYNPDCKVLMYRNVQLYVPGGYAADRLVRKSWLIPPPGGKGYATFRQNNRQYQNWMVNTLANAVLRGQLDGVFLDGASCYPQVNEGTYSIMRRLHERFVEHHKPALILYNGLTIGGIPEATTLAYLRWADGGMMEHFDFHPSIDPSGDSPQKLTQEMNFILHHGGRGKIIVVKAWPNFYWIDSNIGTIPYRTLKRRARQQINFPLACFLACAQPYCYFCYSWGYTDEQGCLLFKSGKRRVIDPKWYWQLMKPLGRPLDEPSVSGYQWTRRFAHANVKVNLKSHTASITWR
jgi:hypothetical protein